MVPIVRSLSLALCSAAVACWPARELSSYSGGAGSASLEPGSSDAASPEVPGADTDDVGPNLEAANPDEPKGAGSAALPLSNGDGNAGDAGTDADCAGENELFEPQAGVCYRVSANAAPWGAAQRACAFEGGNLLTITSASEDAWLAASFPITFWIGANDRAVEGRFEWDSGDLFAFSNFDAGEPNNLFRAQDCVEKVAPSGRWHDRDCNVQNRFVCERIVVSTGFR
jgi:Lectin C-type domain